MTMTRENYIYTKMACFNKELEIALHIYNSSVLWADNEKDKHTAFSNFHNVVVDIVDDIFTAYEGNIEEAIEALEICGWRTTLDFLGI